MIKIISILIIIKVLNAWISYQVRFEYHPEFKRFFMLTWAFQITFNKTASMLLYKHICIITKGSLFKYELLPVSIYKKTMIFILKKILSRAFDQRKFFFK
jgi:hypothetical protein